MGNERTRVRDTRNRRSLRPVAIPSGGEMIRDLWYRFWFSYWRSQELHLTARLDEIDAEENNLIEDRKRVLLRLRKAKAKTTEFGSIQA